MGAPDDQEQRRSKRSRRRKCRDSTDGKKSVLSKPAQRCFPDEQTYGRWKAACVELQDTKENKQVVRKVTHIVLPGRGHHTLHFFVTNYFQHVIKNFPQNVFFSEKM